MKISDSDREKYFTEAVRWFAENPHQTKFRRKDGKTPFSFIKAENGNIYMLGRGETARVGQGGFALVKKAIDKDGNFFAIRIHRKTETSATEAAVAKDEGLTLATAIAVSVGTKRRGLHDEWAPLAKPKFYEVQPLLNQSLKKFLNSIEGKKLTEDQRFYIAMQLVEAVSALHAKGVVHHDLKPDNVMIDPKTLKITLVDFGFAKKYEESQRGVLVDVSLGTIPYLPDRRKDFVPASWDVHALIKILTFPLDSNVVCDNGELLHLLKRHENSMPSVLTRSSGESVWRNVFYDESFLLEKLTEDEGDIIKTALNKESSLSASNKAELLKKIDSAIVSHYRITLSKEESSVLKTILGKNDLSQKITSFYKAKPFYSCADVVAVLLKQKYDIKIPENTMLLLRHDPMIAESFIGASRLLIKMNEKTAKEEIKALIERLSPAEDLTQFLKNKNAAVERLRSLKIPYAADIDMIKKNNDSPEILAFREQVGRFRMELRDKEREKETVFEVLNGVLRKYEASQKLFWTRQSPPSKALVSALSEILKSPSGTAEEIRTRIGGVISAAFSKEGKDTFNKKGRLYGLLAEADLLPESPSVASSPATRPENDQELRRMS